jgi:3-isopropylmalate/(R)-2-methylmalate dehydratase small subunit
VILHELPGAEIAIDLAKQTVTGPDGKTDSFEVDPFRKEMLLKGADEVKITLGYDADIKRFEDKQKQEMPWL